MSNDGERKLVITREFQYFSPKPQGVYPVPESEWERVKRMITEIVPIRSWYQTVAAMFFGVFVSGIFAIVSFSLSKDVPSWAEVTTWSGLVVGFVLTLALFFLDRQQRETVTRSARSVVTEMELLEKGYEKSKQSESNPESPS